MPSLEMNLYFRSLNFRTEVRVFLPEYSRQRDSSAAPCEAFDASCQFPVVYLLHGFTGDYSDWYTMIPVERYANEYGFAIVMPHGYNSWYSNLPHGPRVSDFIAEELPAAMEAILPVSGDPSRRFIAGLSMGGYGAAYHALMYPERYRAFATTSAVLNRGWLREQHAGDCPDDAGIIDRLNYCTGNLPEINELYLGLKNGGKRIPAHLCLYGTEDSMYPFQYRRFAEFAKENALPVQFDSWPGGHDFEFWDPAIRKILAWFRDMKE